MVFSEVGEELIDNGHRGDVTGSNQSVTGTSTDVDNVRDNTGITLGEMKTGTRRN